MTDLAAIDVRDNPGHHRYEAVIDGHTAVATYSLSDDGTIITFIHTVVPEELRGRGIATQLVVAALADVRARGLQVIPECTVFQAWMRKHGAAQDLLAPEGRALLGL